MSVEEGSKEHVDFRVTLFSCLHATLEDLLLRNQEGDDFKILIRTLSHCVYVSGGAIGKQYYDYYCGLGIDSVPQDSLCKAVHDIEFASPKDEVPSAAKWIADCIYLVKEVATSLKEKNNREMEIDASLESLPIASSSLTFQCLVEYVVLLEQHPVRYYALPEILAVHAPASKHATPAFSASKCASL